MGRSLVLIALFAADAMMAPQASATEIGVVLAGTPVLASGARVAVLRIAPDITSTSERERGFLAVAQERAWEVVLDTYIGHGFRETKETAAEALAPHLARLDAVFTPNETTAYGTLLALAEAPAERRPRMVAFDWRPEFLSAITEGRLHASVVQDAFGMGYQAVATLLAAIEGRPLPAQVSVDAVTVTQANLKDDKVQALLARYGL